MNQEIALYRDLLADIKTRIRSAQHRAALSANAEMILLYWDIGRMIAARQEREGWGAGVIPRLAVDLKNDLPEEKGFSERNLGRMIAFFRAYSILPQPVANLEISVSPITENSGNQSPTILPQPVAQLETALAKSQFLFFLPIVQRSVAHLPWGHNVILIEKLKDLPTRLWYARQTKDRILAEYSLKDIHKPIGVADYELTRALPAELASSLPSIETIEAELSADLEKEDPS
jgi:predicted nuclease of restriction endonuclease-like (RecB) superfamily